ncbi:hypothetical protein ACOMHN_043404 [Nucella lapillus]
MGYDRPAHFNKRSLDDVSETSWQAPTSSGDDVTAVKRFNEFVGKRGLLDNKAGKRSPYEYLYDQLLTKRNAGAELQKRSLQYGFLGKRPVAMPLHKQLNLLDLLSKRQPLPYEFVGKKIFGSAWKRISANAVEGDASLKELTDVLNKRGDTTTTNNNNNNPTTLQVPRNKRYAEWLGKRGGPIADQLLRDLVNKRISVMMRNRLQAGAPEFIGRREEEVYLPEELDTQKRYTEFIGK